MEKNRCRTSKGIETVAKEKKGIPMVVNRCGAMLTPFFTNREEK